MLFIVLLTICVLISVFPNRISVEYEDLLYITPITLNDEVSSKDTDSISSEDDNEDTFTKEPMAGDIGIDISPAMFAKEIYNEL